jgi:oligopeptide/dipeptide ABC transporter ATP-binding protein
MSALLEVKNAVKVYGSFHAVNSVSLTVAKGETFALVGESGSGKSTLARMVMGLVEPSGGDILFEGASLLAKGGRDQVRQRMQMVFQDPGASLNPRMKVFDVLREPFRIARQPVDDGSISALAKRVGLGAEHLARYPHELSGGQRQRVAVARAVSLRPTLLVLDEPTSALHVSVQAQVLNLLAELQEEMGLTFLLISHDLAVVRHLSDRCGVMYRGQLVELGTAHGVLEDPRHPYTQLLVRSIPPEHPNFEPRPVLGAPVTPASPRPGGCPFEPRCPLRQGRCQEENPLLGEAGPDRQAACFFLS